MYIVLTNLQRNGCAHSDIHGIITAYCFSHRVKPRLFAGRGVPFRIFLSSRQRDVKHVVDNN